MHDGTALPTALHQSPCGAPVTLPHACTHAQGNSYPITWAVGEHGGIPAGGNLEISLWQGSDCPGQGRMVTLLSSGSEWRLC